MFTDKDYIEYFEMIGEKESQMVDFMKRSIEVIEDENIRDSFRRLMGEEETHVSMVQRLMEIVRE